MTVRTFRGTTTLGWSVWFEDMPDVQYTVVDKQGEDIVYRCQCVDEDDMFRELTLVIGSLPNRGRVTPRGIGEGLGRMRYASVCSGVEAASLAWLPLGWECVFLSEIEPFPCAVLEARFPNVPNLGDMTKIQAEKKENETIVTNGVGTRLVVPGGIDLLVGGTPCQSFSVAGKREGLDGASGLAFHFVRLLKEIKPRWFVWENVPGCQSSKPNGFYEFNFLINAYAECGYSLAWRILDAQYTRVDGYPRAVPQRRRRLFVVGYSGEDHGYPSEVLLEPESMLGHTPPRRVKGQGFTGDTERGVSEASTIRMRAGKPGGGKGAFSIQRIEPDSCFSE